MTAFLAGAVLMTLAAVVSVVIPLFRTPAARAPIAAVAVALVIPAAVIVLYALTSNYPWAGGVPPPAPAAPLVDTPEIRDLKERAAARPGDVEAAVALGDAYLAAERFGDARQAYEAAIAASNGGDDALRLAFAEASILEDRNALQGEVAALIDDVLYRDPYNPKALWYGGMAALARGDADKARQRWGKLLELSPPPRIRQILEQQLASLGVSPGTTPGAAAAAVTIPVRVSISPTLVDRVKPGAALFLFAREPGGAGGPPLAVVRRESPRLPMDLQIGDADSMIPGRTIGGREAVQLTARISAGGDAIAASGDVFGEATWRAGSTGALEIVVDKVVP